MNQWAFVFLQGRCTGCEACTMACKAWNHPRRGDTAANSIDRIGNNPIQADPDDACGTMRENWRRVTTLEQGTDPTNLRISHLSISCMHCSRPPCAAACPTKRIVKEECFGIVTINPDKKCISCGLCSRACPWGAPQFFVPFGRRRDGSAPAPMTKCDLCRERIEQGRKPACVAACPMRALYAGPEKELLAEFPQAVQCVESLPQAPETGPHFWVVPRN